MAKNDITVLTLEQGGSRLLRRVRNGAAGEWTTPLRRYFEAQPVSVNGEEGDAAQAAGDPLAEAFAKAAAEAGGEAVLALPTSQLLVKVLRLPLAVREELADVLILQMAKHAPFSGDDMTVSGEIVSENDEELTVFAAALPHNAVAQFTPLLVKEKLRVNRVDALMLGWWQDVCRSDLTEGRRVFLANVAGEWDLIVADAKCPVLCRGLGVVDDAQALAREVMLSLLNAEIEMGHGDLVEVVTFGVTEPDETLLAALRESVGAPWRHLTADQPDAAMAGVALRAAEGGNSMNLLPEVWRAGNAAADASRSFWRVAIGFLVLWLAAAAVLFGLPAFVKQQVSGVDKALAANRSAFEEVQNIRKRAALIESYMDRSDSVLEAMRVTAEKMPPGLDLTTLTYRREEGLRVAGEATDPALVYQLKDALENEPPFGTCTLTGVSLAADRRKHRFELICALLKGEEEDLP